MAEKPFWEYFAIAEPEGLVLSEQGRFIAFTIMTIAIIIISIQTFYSIIKIRREDTTSGSKVSSYYIIMFIGVFMTSLNSVIIRVSIYFTEGKYTILAQEKAFIFFIGVLLTIYGLTNVTFAIIDFRKSTKRIIKTIYWIFIFLTIPVIITQFLLIAGYDLYNVIEILITVTPVLALIMNIVFIIALIAESKSSPSKIEQLRLSLLALAVFLWQAILLVAGATGVFKDPANPDIWIALTTYIVPLTYAIAQPLMLLVLLWSLHTPNWLLIKSGVIQPSFKAFLEKRKKGGK